MYDGDNGISAESTNPLIKGTPKGAWTTGLFQVGTNKCLTAYACCCPCFAIAEARRLMDGSDVYFNQMCVSSCAIRWLLRSAHEIPGSALHDVLTMLCCYPCAANQMFTTAWTKGPGDHLHDGGFYFNTEIKETEFSCNCIDGLYSCCCLACATGTIMENLLGMPYYFGCCCVTPCAAYQLMRYQHRIRGSDIGGDCMIPMIAAFCGLGLNYSFCCLPTICIGGTLYAYTVGNVTMMLRESRSREGLHGHDSNLAPSSERMHIRYLARRTNPATTSSSDSPMLASENMSLQADASNADDLDLMMQGSNYEMVPLVEEKTMTMTMTMTTNAEGSLDTIIPTNK